GPGRDPRGRAGDRSGGGAGRAAPRPGPSRAALGGAPPRRRPATGVYLGEMLEAARLLPPILRPFGRYELLAKLARGGMAELFLARSVAAPDRLVVIKRILPYLAEDPRFVTMFRDEARLASRIVHPSVCTVLEVGVSGDLYF